MSRVPTEEWISSAYRALGWSDTDEGGSADAAMTKALQTELKVRLKEAAEVVNNAAGKFPEANWKDVGGDLRTVAKLMQTDPVKADALLTATMDQAWERIEPLRQQEERKNELLIEECEGKIKSAVEGLNANVKVDVSAEYPKQSAYMEYQHTCTNLRRQPLNASLRDDLSSKADAVVKAIDQCSLKAFQALLWKRLNEVEPSVIELRHNLPLNLALNSYPFSKAWQDLDKQINDLISDSEVAAIEKHIEQLEAQVKSFKDIALDVEALDKALQLTDQWKEMAVAQSAASNALRNKDSATFKSSVQQLINLANDWNSAKPEWASIQSLGNTAVGAADNIVIDLNGLFGESFKIDKKSDLSKHIAAVREKIGKSFGGDWVDAKAREPVSQDVNKLQLWANTVGDFIATNPNFKTDLKGAFKAEGSQAKTFVKERLALKSALEKLDVSSGELSTAYNVLLKKTGPWTQRLKANAEVDKFKQHFTANWGMGDVDADALAQQLANAGGKCADLTGPGLTKSTFDALKIHYPSMGELLKWVQTYPREATLRELTNNYLPYKEVNGANFASLVNGNQVTLVKGAHKNPFRYQCNNHGGEAEAALDVIWKYGTERDLLWGVVHVHYHGQTTIMRNASNPNSNYYHVKPGNFAGSLGASGAIADAAAKNAIDQAMDNLNLTGKSI